MYIRTLNSLLRSLQKNRSGKLLYYPSKVSFETGNICNLRCPLCPTADEDQKDVKRGFMSFEGFRNVFDKIAPFVKTIDLFSWGEPFLNKDLGKMIKYAKQRKPGIRIFIDSNLNVISEEQVEAVVRYGLDVLKVSCDGATQGVYEQYRVGGDLDAVLGNVRRILSRKAELNSLKPRIIWKYLVFRHNRAEVDEARDMAGMLGVDFEASGMRVDCGKEIFENVEESVERDRVWIPEDTEYDNYRDLTAGKTFCEKPWRTLTVNWDGEVVPCGAIYDCARYSFGNLLRQGFDEVWNGEKFVLARGVISGKSEGKKDHICSICKENGYQFF